MFTFIKWCEVYPTIFSLKSLVERWSWRCRDRMHGSPSAAFGTDINFHRFCWHGTNFESTMFVKQYSPKYVGEFIENICICWWICTFTEYDGIYDICGYNQHSMVQWDRIGNGIEWDGSQAVIPYFEWMNTRTSQVLVWTEGVQGFSPWTHAQMMFRLVNGLILRFGN